MRRRDLIAMLGGAAALGPLAARAQRPAMPVIGYLHSGTRISLFASNLRAFRQGLGEAGFVEGRNATIEDRSANGHYARLPALAADLVRRKVDVIFAQGLPAARAAKAATSSIPIVFTSGGDPVARGLVASLRRPGGNVTGVTMLIASLIAKRLELLRELRPHAAAVALLVNPTNPNAKSNIREITAATAGNGARLRVLTAATDRELDRAFAALAGEQADLLLVAGDPFFAVHAARIVALAARVRVPAAYDLRLFVDAGGLASYGPSVADALRHAGRYTGRILKGEKPGDLPVQRSARFELVLNLKTAKALGLTIPRAVLVRADEVIE